MPAPPFTQEFQLVMCFMSATFTPPTLTDLRKGITFPLGGPVLGTSPRRPGVRMKICWEIEKKKKCPPQISEATSPRLFGRLKVRLCDTFHLSDLPD